MNFYEKENCMPEEIVMSNDAYYYLLNGELCIDEANQAEAEQIKARFVSPMLANINVSDSVELLPGGLVKAIITPVIFSKSEHNYTHYIKMFNNWQLEIEQIDAKHVYIRFHNTITHNTFGHELCELQYGEKGHTTIATKNGGRYPFWSGKSTSVNTF